MNFHTSFDKPIMKKLEKQINFINNNKESSIVKN